MNEKEFADVVNQNRQKIYYHCLHLIHDEELAEDLTQETFIHAYQHLDSFRGEAKVSTWLWRIAHNLCLNYLKKHPPLENSLIEEIIASPPSTINEVDQEHLDLILEAIKTLPKKQRVVIEKFELEHLPQKQIAAELGISYGTVRSRIYYARKKIREFLREA